MQQTPPTEKSTFDSFCEHFEKANIFGTYNLIKTEDNRLFAIEQTSGEVIEFTASYRTLFSKKPICLCQGIGGGWVYVTVGSD